MAIRLPDGDDRSVEEILEGDLPALLAAGPPATVLLCAIPTGPDPDEYLAAAATSDRPPQVDGGPPHLVHGMADDLVVSG